MRKPAMIAAVALLSVSCTAGDTAFRALKGAGYSNVEITGYRIFGCGDGDTFHTGFRAVGPTGAVVTGIVCSGFLKGATIRLD